MIRNYNVLSGSRNTTLKNRSVIDVDIPLASFTTKSKKSSTYVGWLVAFLLLFSFTTNAQVNGYSFSQTSGTYNPLSAARTVVFTATAGATADPGLSDDQNYTLPAGTIPFTFNFNGIGYTGVNINSNGYLTFGATLPLSTDRNGLTNTTAWNASIVAMGKDLSAATNATNLGEISYEVLGSAPNRKFVIQYSKYRFFSSSTVFDNNLNFQIVLNEGGGSPGNQTVDVIYGTNTVTQTSTTATSQPLVGLRGTTTADFRNRTTTTAGWAASTAGATNTTSISMRLTTTSFPASGLTFTWTPPAGMAYASSTTEQITGNANTPGANQAIIRVKVTTTGSTSPISLTSLTLNANGTTNIANINASTAKVYYTGASTTFSTGTLFGSAIPTIANFNVTGSQALVSGDNYFWLAYDVVAGATAGNVIDGECTGMVVAAAAQTPTVTAPAGNKVIVAPLAAGSYTVGSGGTYASLTNAGGAFEAINTQGTAGAITLNIISDLSGELGTVALNTIGSGFSVLIKPSGAPRVITGTFNGALIRFAGASNITVDGSTSGGTDRSLTITNTSITSPSVLLFGSVGTSPISNNTLKNTIIINGINTSSAVVISDATTLGNQGYFSNITIQNNDVQKAFVGVYATGGTTTPTGSNLTYTQNTLNTAGANAIRNIGLYMQGVTGATVTNNTIGNFDAVTAENDIAIWAATGTSNATISGNTISTLGMTGSGAFGPIGIRESSGLTSSGTVISANSISSLVDGPSATSSTAGIDVNSGGTTVEKNNISGVNNAATGTYGAYGINIVAGNNSIVRNNFVSNITGDMSGGAAFSTQFGIFGIRIAGGTGHQVYYNSVNMYGARSGTATSSLLTAAFAVTTTASTGVDVRNNIFANKITGGTTSIANVAVWVPSAGTSAMNLTMNNNQYYFGTDAAAGVGQAGTTAGTNFYTTLAAMAAYTSTLSPAATNDNASAAFSAPTVFTTNTDLHLTVSNDLATPLASVTTDIDNVTRSATTPDIGADEFTGTNCTGAVGGTATGSNSFCISGTPTIAATGYSIGTGGTYQWMSSASSSNYPASGTPIGGQTNPASLTTGVVSTTTYYWLKVTCATGVATAYSNMITVTVTPMPAVPALACYQYATFNSGTCSWDVAGTQPTQVAGTNTIIAESFDDFSTLAPAGWTSLNVSDSPGNGWGQGGATWNAQTGAPTAWAVTNYTSVSTGVGTISNWLISPPKVLQNGDVIKFWTRGPSSSSFPDRMQVRLSTAGGSTGMGTNPTNSSDLGSYTTLLADINPTYTVNGYPTDWAEYTFTVSGLSGPTLSRVGFRYFVENGGPAGANSDIIGIDTFSITRTAAALGCPAQSYVFNSGTCGFTVSGSCASVVNLKLFIEGYYQPGLGTMRSVNMNQGVVGASSTDVETITVELHNPTAPYALAHTASSTMLKTNGNAVANFPTAPSGSYYIVVRTRNAVDTWSATPQTVGASPLTYDFSSAATQAFGANMVDMNGSGTYGFYSGDIDPTHDGNIDTIDYPVWETDSNNFESGIFHTDLNGDGNVDTIDYPIWENNSNNFISVVKP